MVESTVGQVGDLVSPEIQCRQIHEFFEERGWDSAQPCACVEKRNIFYVLI